MKYFIIVLALFGLVHANSTTISKTDNGYMRVIGVGKTFDDAKLNGFKNAIAMVVGSAVLSDNEVANNKLLKEEIIDYSAGYIHTYEIIDKIEKLNNITLVMDVIVKQSKIHEKILNQGKTSKEIEGDKIYNQYSTYLYERKSGDRYLYKVLDSYPKNAFILTQGSTEIKLDQHRNAVIIVPFDIKWSYPYLVALNESLEHMQDGDKRSPHRVNVISKNPDRFLFGSNKTYYFNDSNRADIIRGVINPNFFIAAKLKNNTQHLYTECFKVDSTFAGAPDKNTYTIYGNDSFSSTIQIKFNINDSLFKVLMNGEKIELSLVDKCLNDK